MKWPTINGVALNMMPAWRLKMVVAGRFRTRKNAPVWVNNGVLIAIAQMLLGEKSS